MWPFSKKETRASIENPSVPISAPNVLQLLGWDVSGVRVTPERALEVPAVWSAVNFLSGTMASLPLNVYQRETEGRTRLVDTPMHRMLHDAPNRSWTSYRWRKYSQMQTLLRGRSYTFIERNGNGLPVNLWPLNPQNIKIQPVERNGMPSVVYQYRTESFSADYEAEDIIDVPFMLQSDQVNHVDPTVRLKTTLGLAIALQEYAQNFFNNGGVPPLVLEGPFQSPSGIKRAAHDVDEAVKAAAKEQRAILPLPAGHQLKPVGFNPSESQMNESRRFQLEEIARVYDLPPVFLQDLTHGTYSNTEQQDLHFVKHTLTQWTTCWEQELNLKLFPRSSRRFVEFNVDGLLRGDFKTRMEGMAQAVQNSLMTPNEGRAMENRPAKTGGDDLMVQQNMQGLGRLGSNGDDDGN